MPNKNSIESEVREQILDILRWPYNKAPVRLTQSEAMRQQRATEILAIFQREVKKGRVEELDALHDDLSIEAREAGACEAIHKRANSILDRLEELEG